MGDLEKFKNDNNLANMEITSNPLNTYQIGLTIINDLQKRLQHCEEMYTLLDKNSRNKERDYWKLDAYARSLEDKIKLIKTFLSQMMEPNRTDRAGRRSTISNFGLRRRNKHENLLGGFLPQSPESQALDYAFG